MGNVMAFGGWFEERQATGVSRGIVKTISAVATAIVLTVASTNTATQIKKIQQPTAMLHDAEFTPVVTEAVRTPLENLNRIREVLSPAVSDLATTLGVTRQSIYNWLNGAPVADDNAAKLRDLAQAADILAHEGVKVNASFLKRKFANGKTLLQVAQAGESARQAAQLFVQIHKREIAQRERLNARFAKHSKSPATADFDLPSANDL